MKKRIFPAIAVLLALTCVLAFSTSAFAAKGGGAGIDGGGAEAPDYGDLFVLYRNDNGVPILKDGCQQPLAAAEFVGCDDISSAPGDCLLIPVDLTTCTVDPEYASYTQEVDFGRINAIRFPDSVFETQLEEAIITLATADCISLDPAGRLVASSTTDDGVTETSTIDSPIQNMAIYRQLMLEGDLGEEVPLTDWLDTAARAFGVASAKDGEVTVDMVAYANQILGLTDPETSTMLDKTCIKVREEVQGQMQEVTKCFLYYGDDYGNDYSYARGINFGSLPSPAYIPADLPQDGLFEYLTLSYGSALTFEIAQGLMVDAVPELLTDPTLHASNIAGFVQVADDTRAVIEFMHTWPVPGDYATPVSCEASGGTFYDVSISDDSGLQVPVRMVAGTEGREGTVTVANAGPAEAIIAVMVSGIDSEGNSVTPLYAMSNGPPTDEQIFDVPEEFVLPAGFSKSWTFFFSMEEPTEITWTATVAAPDDVNLSNNTVTETTIVIGSSKRGGNH